MCDSNMSFVQKEGRKIVVVDEAVESTVVVDETMLLGKEFQILIARLVIKYLVVSIEKKSGLSLN